MICVDQSARGIKLSSSGSDPYVIGLQLTLIASVTKLYKIPMMLVGTEVWKLVQDGKKVCFTATNNKCGAIIGHF